MNQVLQLFHHRSPVSSVAFSPNGTVFASVTCASLRLYNTATGKCCYNVCKAMPCAIIAALAFSPDGTQLAFTSSTLEHGWVYVWDVAKRQVVKQLSAIDNTLLSLAYSHDGTHIAAGSCDETVCVWTCATSILENRIAGANAVFSVAYAGDGQWLAFSYKESIKIVTCPVGEPRSTLIGHRGSVQCVVFSPTDSNQLASTSYDNDVRLWSIDGNQCVILSGHTAHVPCVAYSADGRYVASGSVDTTVRVWSASTGQCCQILRGHFDTVRCVAFSPDTNGKHIVSGAGDHVAILWQTLDTRWLATMAFLLLSTGVAPYVALDIIDMLRAAEQEIGFDGESTYMHWRKIQVVNQCQRVDAMLNKSHM